MIAPRLEIDLDKIHHNARTLIELLADRGISVTGVTKATLGSPEIAGALLRAGVSALGDSRIENIEAMRRARVRAPMTLIRSPMLSQVDRIVRQADISFNTEINVISKLSSAAKTARRTHGVVLMVELGDLREGIMPGDLATTLLGREPLHRQPIDGLHTDAITLVAEVIESKAKPSQPWGEIAQTAFGDKPPGTDQGHISQTILAVGHQDTDPGGLHPPTGIEILGASSDHLITDSGCNCVSLGAEMTFQLNYSALLRAMTSPFVTKVVKAMSGPIFVPASHFNHRILVSHLSDAERTHSHRDWPGVLSTC